MSELVDMLRKFNRKERYWLLRNALGSKSEVLDEDFRSRLAKSVGFEIPESAWWAIDYHFDWMVGALHMLSNGKPNEPEAKEIELVTGSQEDIDLLISFDKTLLFVEAKADTSWSIEQWESKCCRLDAIRKYLADKALNLRVRFVLVSPGPTSICISKKRPEHEELSEWLFGNTGLTPPRVELLGFREIEFFRVQRCKENGASDKGGTHWQVVNNKTNSNHDESI